MPPILQRQRRGQRRRVSMKDFGSCNNSHTHNLSSSSLSWSNNNSNQQQNSSEENIWQELCERSNELSLSSNSSSSSSSSNNNRNHLNHVYFSNKKSIFGITSSSSSSAPNGVRLDQFEDDDDGEHDVIISNCMDGGSSNCFLRSRLHGCSTDLSALARQRENKEGADASVVISIDNGIESDVDEQTCYFDCASSMAGAGDSIEEDNEEDGPWGHFVDVLNSPRVEFLDNEDERKRKLNSSCLTSSWNPYSEPAELRKKEGRRQQFDEGNSHNLFLDGFLSFV